AEPATAEDYELRDLPAPGVRSVVAAIEEAQWFGGRCTAEGGRLGGQAGQLSVPGGGGGGGWEPGGGHLPRAGQLLDGYHGCEKLAKAGRAALGEGEALQRWLDGARGKLLGDGYAGVCEVVAALSADEATAARLGATAGEVLNYFCGHQDRLGYAVR